MQRKTVRDRILSADPTLRVDEIVLPNLMRPLSKGIADKFGEMTIDWQPNRAWGLSFRLGVDDKLKLGHRRGDHLATHPYLSGFSGAEAERILRIQVGGTAMHELGHALFDDYLEAEGERAVMRRAAMAALEDGALSDYRGMRTEGMSDEDILHEMFAEAFRYMVTGDSRIRRTFPHWAALYDDVLRHAKAQHD